MEEKSERTVSEVENNLHDVLTTEIEPTIDFAKEGYKQVKTKGGLRWVLKKKE